MTHSTGWIRAALLALLVACAPAPARGDTLVRTGRPPLQGKILAESDESVTFEAHSMGYAVRLEVPRQDIVALTRETTAGVGYCVLPISGVIGEEVPADAFAKAVDRARSAGARWIILEIDSPGGTIDGMTRICQTIRSRTDVHFVAHVKQAGSAAAIIALSCPRIYMAPNATIGAAVPFQLSDDGLPEVLKEKFAARVLAQMRAAAEAAGHDPLLVRAMTEPGVQLSVVTQDGTPQIMLTDRVPAEADARGEVRVLKTRDTILSATAAEAAWCGLSAGTAATVEDVRQAIGIKLWHQADDLAPAMLDQARDQARRASLAAAQRRRNALQQQALVAHTHEELAALRADAALARQAITDAQVELEALPAAYRQQAEALEAAFHADADKPRPANEVAAARAAAQETYRRRMADLDQQFKDKADAIAARRHAAEQKLADLAQQYQSTVEPLQQASGATP